MFQFRAFPSYAYLIQRTIHRYCLCGFPHSEISGSTDICSSPKLIAACHVLHRLLMPRHSPCALYSLTKEIHLVLLNYAGNQQVTSQNCNCYPHLFRCSTINRFTNFFQLSLKDLSVALLFITFFIVQFSRYKSFFQNDLPFCFAKPQLTLSEPPARPQRNRLYVALRAPLNLTLF